MNLTSMKVSTPAEMASFEDECFRAWLNIVDARMGYDERHYASSIPTWRACFDVGMSPKQAIVESYTWF